MLGFRILSFPSHLDNLNKSEFIFIKNSTKFLIAKNFWMTSPNLNFIFNKNGTEFTWLL